MKNTIESAWSPRVSCKAALSLTLAVLFGILCVTPAVAKNDKPERDRRVVRHQPEPKRGDRYARDYRQDHRPYHYAQPVYVPPPVYYEPQQSPGISLFFPLDLRR